MHAKDEILRHLTSCLETRGEIETVYVFGSFLEKAPFSDIDLGIMTQVEPQNPIDYEIQMEQELQGEIGFPVDVRVINAAPVPFVYNIVRHGLLLIDKDSSRRADFESLILRKYFDFQYYRLRYLKEVANAPL